MTDVLMWLAPVSQDSFAVAFLDAIVKATALLLLVGSVAHGLRRSSAAVRHRVWCLVFGGLLAVPILSALLPGWRIPILPVIEQTAVDPPTGAAPQAEQLPLVDTQPSWDASQALVQSDDILAQLPPGFDEAGSYPMGGGQRDPELLQSETAVAVVDYASAEEEPPASHKTPTGAKLAALPWRTIILGAWALGIAVTAVPIFIGLVRNRILGNAATLLSADEQLALVRQLARQVNLERPVRVLETRESLVPMTWGVFRPIVMLPTGWRDWSPQRQRLVLLHELAHVKRRDVAYQLIGRIACCLYWFHPLVWYALWRLRIERELACDDCVLMAGERPSDYAQQLLEIARTYRMPALPGAVAIAHSGSLEQRVRAMLDRARSHLPLSRTVGAALLFTAAVVVTGMAAVRPGTQDTQRLDAPEAIDDAIGIETEPDDSSVARVDPEEDTADEVLTLSGQVLDTNNRPVAGARVLVVRTHIANSSWRETRVVESEIRSESDGSFELRVPRTTGRFSDGMSFVDEYVSVIAVAKGSAPDEFPVSGQQPGQNIELRLQDAPSTFAGRVLNLEGRPLAGVRIAVEEVYAPQSPIDDWIEQSRKYSQSGGTDSNNKPAPRFPMSKQIRTRGLPLFETVTTDRLGRFRIAGLANDSRVKLRVDGDGIVSTWLQAVVRDMEPIADTTNQDPRYRSGLTFGNNFDYSAEPSQPIVGTVRDSETGEPLPGVDVELYQYGESRLAVENFLATKTDESGRYELPGIPKPRDNSPQVRLRVLPGAGLPYFRQNAFVPRQDGISPVAFDIELQRAIWVHGQVTDSKTGEPVQALVSYYPFADNPHAADSQVFEPGVKSLGYVDQYATDEGGRFRIPGLPGRGALWVVAQNGENYQVGVGADEIEGLQGEDRINLYHMFSADLCNTIAEIDAAAADAEIECNASVVPHDVIRLQVFDSDGEPANGVRMAGRRPMSGRGLGGNSFRFWDELPQDTDHEFEVLLGNESDRQRPLIFTDQKRLLGRVSRLPDFDLAAGETQAVTLAPFAELTGRFIDKDGKPISNGYVRAGVGEVRTLNPDRRENVFELRGPALAWPLPGGVDLNEEGEFTFMVPPGADYALRLQGTPGRWGLDVAARLNLDAGERVALGEINIDADPKTWPKPSRVAARTTVSSNARAAAKQTDATLQYAGTVVDPDGNPVAGAKIYLTYWIHGAPLHYAVDPLAKTDAQGHFEFNRSTSDFARSGNADAWQGAGIVASADGFGFADGFSPSFETTGYVTANAKPAALKFWKRKPTNPDRVLRLVEDDVPLTGRVLTIDGQPVAGARVGVDRLWWSENGNLDAWEQATGDPKADFYSLRTHTSSGISGPQLPSIIPATATDREGRFTLRGIGRERIAQLVISGPGVESDMIKARTRAGETVEVPHQWNTGNADFNREIYFPADFAHVPGPSKPVVGRVTDADTGEPIAGVRLTAGIIATFIGGGKPYLATLSDEDGRYRLEGLPIGKRDKIYLYPPSSTTYLPAGIRLDTRTDEPHVTRDLKLKQGVLVRGRVVDERTNQPVPGRVQYFAFDGNPHLQAFLHFGGSFIHERRTDGAGRFEIPVLPGQGVLGFTAHDHTRFRRGVGTENITVPANNEQAATKMYRTQPTALISSNEHILQQIDPDVGSEPLEVTLELTSGADILGRLVDPNGVPLAGGIVQSAVYGNSWRPIPGETFRVEGYYADAPRDLFFYHAETDLGGHYRLEGEAPAELTIKLQPTGSVRGRLLDEQGDRLAGVMLTGAGIAGDNFGETKFRLATDAEGRFLIRGLLPGREYTVMARSDAVFGRALVDVTVEAGQTKDVGDVTLQSLERARVTSSSSGAAIEGSKESAAQPKSNVAKSPRAQTVTVRGIVLKPDGMPLAGATVRAATPMWASIQEVIGYDTKPPMSETICNADGRFSVSFSTQPFGDLSRLDERWQNIWKKTTIVALAPGYGPAWTAYADVERGGDVTLQLVDDLPIKGRVMDLEGRPVANIALKLRNLQAAEDEDLTSWIDAIKAGELPWTVSRFVARSVNPQTAGVPGTVTTDVEGRFEIRGVGRERCIHASFAGETVAHHSATFVTRLMSPIERLMSAPPHTSRSSVYGAELTITAAPSRPIAGTVTDAQTGLPLADVSVESNKLSGNRSSGHRVLKTKTDKQGRYRLIGMPKGDDNELLIVPNDDQPYFMRELDLPNPEGLSPITADIELHRGLWITGRVTDKATAQPVYARMHYLPMRSNEYAEAIPEFRDGGGVDGFQSRYQTRSDGTYRLVGLPGPAIVAAESVLKQYRIGVGADGIDAPRRRDDSEFDTYFNPVNPGPKWPNVMKWVDPPADSDSVPIDFEMDPGLSVQVEMVDPDNRPLAGVTVDGHNARGYRAAINKPQFEAINFGPDEERTILFHHEKRNLGWVARLRATDSGGAKAVARLQPCATVSGRLLLADDVPCTGVVVTAQVSPSEAFGKSLPSVTTDADGRFRCTVLPGTKYLLKAEGNGIRLNARISSLLAIQPGQNKNLGDLVYDGRRIFLRRRQASKRVAPPTAAAEPVKKAEGRAKPAGIAAGRMVTVRGVVRTPDGQPLAGATVRAATPIYAMLKPIVGRNAKPRRTETTSDDDGRFSISFSTQPFGNLSRLDAPWRDIWKKTKIAAFAPGYGPAWVEFEDIEQGAAITLKLVDDMPIRGRVIDLEGQPIAATTVQIGGPSAAKDEDLTRWLDGVKAGELPWTVWKHAPKNIDPQTVGIPNSVTTDDEGRFEIRGVGRERRIAVVFEGERVAHQSADIATRQMDRIERVVNTPPFDGTEPVFGAEFTFTAAPSRLIEGVAYDAGTRAPLAGVGVESYKLVGYPMSNHRVLKTTTDARGRFRLIGMPKGAGNKLLVVPNDDQPYFMRLVDVPNPAGLAPAKVEIELHRGLWITGRVTDKNTGEPAHSRLHYLPLRSNKYAQAIPEFSDSGNVDGDQLRYQTRPDGTFRLVGLPGPAIVGAESVLKAYRSGVGADEIDVPKYRDTQHFDTYRNPLNPSPKWPNVMKHIAPAPEADLVAVDFELDPGLTVRVQTIDSEGQPISGVSVHGRSTRGSRDVIDEATFDAINFGPGEQRTIVLHHKQRNLGWVARLQATDAERAVTIQLQPCATVTGRLLHADSAPYTGVNVQANVRPAESFGKRLPGVTTDSEGRFRYTLVPGCKYWLSAEGQGIRLNGTIENALDIKPGETRDLGELVYDGKAGFEPRLGDPKPLASSTPAAEPANRTDAPAKVTLRGRVRGPNGEPVPAAQVWMAGPPRRSSWGRTPQTIEWIQLARSDNDGWFEATVDRGPFDEAVARHPEAEVRVAATAKDFGFAWSEVKASAPEGEITLQLVADVPIEGRILTLDGQPAAGVRLSVNHIIAPPAGVDGIIKSASLSSGVYTNWPPWPGGPPPNKALETGADGRFRLEGFGAERLVRLEAIGGGIGATRLAIVTRATPAELEGAGTIAVRDGLQESMYYANFSHVGVPGRTLRGVVTDVETGGPVAGVRVTTYSSWKSRKHPSVTAADGRFEITGVPKSDDYRLQFEPADSRHFNKEVVVADTEGLAAIDANITLATGISAVGRVTDAETGEPVSGSVVYSPLFPNEHVVRLGNDLEIANPAASTRIVEDGRYELRVLPGPGVIAVRLDGQTYLSATVDIDQLKTIVGRRQIEMNGVGDVRFLHTAMGVQAQGAMGLDQHQAAALINPPTGKESLTIDLTVVPGRSRRGTIVDDAGQPLQGVKVIGLGHSGTTTTREPLESADFTVEGLGAGRKRTLLFVHPDRQLGAEVIVTGDDLAPIKVQLQPTGSVTGRFVNEVGEPLPLVSVQVSPHDPPIYGTAFWTAEVDDNGHFQVTGLISGCSYRVHAKIPEERVALFVQNVTGVSGEKQELGEFIQNDRFEFVARAKKKVD